MDLDPLTEGSVDKAEVMLSTGRAGRRAGVSVDTVRRWILHGVPLFGRTEFLAGYQVGSHWRVPEKELLRFLASIQTTPRARAAVRQDQHHQLPPNTGAKALAQGLKEARSAQRAPRRTVSPTARERSPEPPGGGRGRRCPSGSENPRQSGP